MSYPKWSERRKWDLHLHSLYSNLNNQFNNCSVEDYIEKIKEKNISVVWLTNYFNFNNEDFELKRKLEESWIVVFLNLELRLTYQNTSNQNCDFHVIFHNDIEESLIRGFLANLDVKLWRITKKATQISGNDYNTCVVEFSDLLEKLGEESLSLKNKYLLWFLSRWHWSARSATTYEDIANKAHILIHSSNNDNNVQEDVNFWLWNNKPLVQTSDAHSISQIWEKYTWIKADPTFEWLKQIIYEPKERVKIRLDNPNYDFDKPYFKEIIFDEDIKIYNQQDSEIKIKKSKIELNNNLVTIIWWRGTGKSTLIWYINNTFESNNIYSKDNNFKIIYSKNNDENPSIKEYVSWEDNYLDYIYIPQWYLKENSDKEKISKYIKQLLSIDDNFSYEIIEKINKNEENINELEKRFNSTDLEWNLINNKNFVNEQKKKNEEMLKNIETEKNKQNLATYTSNIEKITKLQWQIVRLEKLLSSLNSVEKLNEEINQINSEYGDLEWYKAIWNIEYSDQKTIIIDNKQILLQKMDILNSENKSIKEKFVRYTWDLESLLLNAELYKRNITSAEQQLQLISEKEAELDNLLKKRKNFWKVIYNEYLRLKNNIDVWWSNITSNRSEEQKELIENLLLKKNWETGVKVEWCIDFDEESFYTWLLDIVDNRTYKKKEDIKEKIWISDIESWYKFIESWFEDFSDNYKVISYFLDIQKRSNYIKVNSNITYMRKNLKYLSVWQRWTVLLCLQLATKAFSTPIIFDQPEDDLDNQFIMDELVDIFKELKKYRQIIIVTHNANLVLNADAEQVIVAENDNEDLKYMAWSIENKIIRGKICDVLEWWENAFRKRENKYWLN